MGGGGLTEVEPDAFEDLYRVEYPGMVRLAFVLLGDGDTAEDVVQDALPFFTPSWARWSTRGAICE